MLNRKILKIILNKPKRYSTYKSYEEIKVMDINKTCVANILKFSLKTSWFNSPRMGKYEIFRNCILNKRDWIVKISSKFNNCIEFTYSDLRNDYKINHKQLL